MAKKKITPTNPETAVGAQDEANGTASGAPVDNRTTGVKVFRKTAGVHCN